MSVDKFGRHESTVNVRRETKRQLHETIGYKITDEGDIDVENKRICKLADPTESSDAVPLHFMQENCLLLSDGDGVDVKGYKLHNVDTPVEPKDGVNKLYIKDTCLCYAKSINNEPVINARSHKIISLGEPSLAKDAATKFYVDKMTIPMDQDSNYVVKNRRITLLAPPVNSKDAVNLEFMLKKTLRITDADWIDVGDRVITNLRNGSFPTDSVNVRQMEELKLYVKSETFTLAKVFQSRMDKLLSYIYKLHKHDFRSSLNAEESELTVNDNTETRALIAKIDKDKSEKDWRTVYD